MILGVTGGVGSGKSTVLDILKTEYDAEIVVMDEIGIKLMQQGNICYNSIVNYFGSDILMENGDINRNILAEYVFNNQVELNVLNGIIHPAVKEYCNQKIQLNREGKGKEILVLESAILFEANYEQYCDVVWFVYVNNDIRIKRLIDTRGYSLEKINSIMINQKSDEEFEKLADYKIDNSGSIEKTHEQIKTVMQQYTHLSI